MHTPVPPHLWRALPLMLASGVFACTRAGTTSPLSDDTSHAKAVAAEQPAAQAEPEPYPRFDGGVDVTASSRLTPGPAYFSMAPGPIIELAVDGSTRELQDPRAYASTRHNRFVQGRDGKVYLLTYHDGLMRIDGARLVPVLKDARGAAAVTSTGVVWALDHKRLLRVGDAGVEEIEPPALPVNDMVLDGDDTVWVSVNDELFRRDDPAWTKVQLHNGSLFSGDWTLATHPRFGGVYAACDSAISRVATDGRVTPVGRLEPTSGSGSSNLQLAFSGASAGLAYRDDGRIFALPFEGDELGPDPFNAPGIVLDAAAIDDRGRAWVATPSVVMVADLTTEAPTTMWHRGAVPRLDGRIVAIAVQGSGPPLPKGKPIHHRPITLSILDAAVPESDALIDTLTAEGEHPAAGVNVELCRAEHDSIVAATPCEGSPSRVAGVTAADGTVTLQLAPGPYTAAIQTAERWYRIPVDVPVSSAETIPPLDLTHGRWWLPKPAGL